LNNDGTLGFSSGVVTDLVNDWTVEEKQFASDVLSVVVLLHFENLETSRKMGGGRTSLWCRKHLRGRGSDRSAFAGEGYTPFVCESPNDVQVPVEVQAYTRQDDDDDDDTHDDEDWPMV
jgi:hypothetical protein